MGSTETPHANEMRATHRIRRDGREWSGIIYDIVREVVSHYGFLAAGENGIVYPHIHSSLRRMHTCFRDLLARRYLPSLAVLGRAGRLHPCPLFDSTELPMT